MTTWERAGEIWTQEIFSGEPADIFLVLWKALTEHGFEQYYLLNLENGRLDRVVATAIDKPHGLEKDGVAKWRRML